MPAYICKACNFSSDLRTNFCRHLLTPKHKKRIVDSYTLRDEEEKKEYSSLLIAHKCSQNAENGQKSAQKSLCSPKKRIKKLGNKSLHVCEFCEKTFSRVSNLKRHLELYCKKKNEKNEDDDIKKLLEKTIIQQSKDINKILEKVPSLEEISNITRKSNQNITNNHIFHNTINNFSNTINNTININNFGNENLNMLTNKFMSAMIDKPYTAIPKMIKKYILMINIRKIGIFEWSIKKIINFKL